MEFLIEICKSFGHNISCVIPFTFETNFNSNNLFAIHNCFFLLVPSTSSPLNLSRGRHGELSGLFLVKEVVHFFYLTLVF